ncbi:GNAT family N-acetyltransferase [Cellulomonas triticagri]|uniref:GNAT family N-acetyltransferase n=1 Tax=Cellulomonas triticagri TaxID=2483352 RepID=A0A3M2J1H1_9CELL|nr:GNAT family N-acetyltransferase [Cellulomonas triticagri]RMI06654.1 GNAT family N-acetyltransferase [Cellulomonas triticagri]
MLADLVLRPFDPADADAVTGLLHRAYGGLAERGLNFTAATQDAATTVRRAAAGPTWVLWDAADPVATLTLSLPPARMLQDLTAEAAAPGRAWLNQMGVDPAHQGRGLARHLRDVALAHAAAHGVTGIGVDTAESAQDLLDLYDRWGFVRRDVIRWPGKTYPSVVLVRDVR